MHATIRSYSGVPGLVDTIVANADEVRRLLRDIDGFRAYYLLRISDDRAASVSVYDDQAGTEASTAVAREWIAANAPGLTASPPEVLSGEVALDA